MKFSTFLHLITLAYSQTPFNPPEISLSSNPDARKAELSRMQDAIHSTPRYHLIKNEQTPFRYPNGPDVSYGTLAAQLASSEVDELRSRDNKSVQKFLFGKMLYANVSISTLDDLTALYEQFTPVMPHPPCIVDWETDAAFGETQLTFTGSELQIFDETDAWLSDDVVQTITGHSFNELLAQKRLFKNDLSWLKKYSLTDGPKYLPGASGLFYIADDNSFLPLAIKVVDNGLVYSPLDDPNHWLLAKLALSIGESLNIPFKHFIVNHMALEAARTELLRYTSSEHPLHVLLEHHFKGVYGNTVIGLERIINNGTTYDMFFGTAAHGLGQYIQDFTDVYNYGDRHVAKSFAKFGLMDIPNYRKRDDLLRIQNATNGFVHDFLGLYYTSDDLVAQDSELQSWLSATSAQTLGFPATISTLDELVDFTADLIMRVSAYHHSLNNENVWNGMSFPAYPKAFWKPFPQDKQGDVNIRDFLVKDRLLMTYEIVTTAAYSLPVPQNETMGRIYWQTPIADVAGPAIEKYVQALDEISALINDRESLKKRKYVVLDPKKLADRVWI